MRSERGQATVEWIGVVLLVALALAALTRVAPHADGHTMATTLAHSITAPKSQVAEIRSGKRNHSLPPASESFMVPLLVPHPGQPPARFRARFRGVPAPLLGQTRRGAGKAWRRAWYACLIYERFRWAFLHPESRFPGYTMPPEEVLRIANDCISPVDLVRDWPMLSGRAG